MDASEVFWHNFRVVRTRLREQPEPKEERRLQYACLRAGPILAPILLMADQARRAYGKGSPA